MNSLHRSLRPSHNQPPCRGTNTELPLTYAPRTRACTHARTHAAVHVARWQCHRLTRSNCWRVCLVTRQQRLCCCRTLLPRCALSLTWWVGLLTCDARSLCVRPAQKYGAWSQGHVYQKRGQGGGKLVSVVLARSRGHRLVWALSRRGAGSLARRMHACAVPRTAAHGRRCTSRMHVCGDVCAAAPAPRAARG